MQTDYDIVICGAGPVGLTLARLLVRRGVPATSIALIDAKTEADVALDRRTIALSFGSRQILAAADAWPVTATAIHEIHVSRAGRFGRTMIRRDAWDVPALGYVARYVDIVAPLTTTLARDCAGLTMLRPLRVEHLEPDATHVTVTLSDQRRLTAKIVVQAEGGMFGEQQALTRHRDYQQTALISRVSASAPIAARAYERFTDHGPLALLPQGDDYALVWCVQPERAEALIAMDDAAFLQQLQVAFGNRLGRFVRCAPRVGYALGLNAEPAAPDGRVVRIGNAAQTLHPVAGQGLNLGLRDARELACALARDLSPAALQAFHQARQADRGRTVFLTDQMARVFASPQLPQSLLGLGLGLIDAVRPAKQWLAHQMMFGAR